MPTPHINLCTSQDFKTFLYLFFTISQIIFEIFCFRCNSKEKNCKKKKIRTQIN